MSDSPGRNAAGVLAALFALGSGGSVVAASQPAAPPGASHHKASLVADMDCSACHTSDGWKIISGGGTGGGFDHAKTGFPLTGTHQTTPCVGCHVPGRPLTRECAGCHADFHAGQLGATCDRCHRSTAWNDTQTMDDHSRTRLPLTGMHALLDCTACHLRTGEREYGETPADCFACHEADYRNQATHPAHTGNPNATPPQPAFPRDCTVCHTAVGWIPAFLPAAFVAAPAAATPQEHERWFPIQSGTHRAATCESCHERGDKGGRVSCQGCHQHSTLRLLTAHRGKTMPLDGQACLHCHPAGAFR